MACAETAALPLSYSYIETGADNGVRTRDVLLGKQVLYQLSYIRIIDLKLNSRYMTGLEPAAFFRRSAD